jgi:hypothetical protein
VWGSHDSVPREIAEHNNEQHVYPRVLEKGYSGPYLQRGKSISNWELQTGQSNISGLQTMEHLRQIWERSEWLY